MKSTIFLLAGVAASAFAMPKLATRQEAGKPAIDCGGEIYDEVEDSNAWVRGCTLSVFPPSVPADFPTAFEDTGDFNFTSPTPWNQFPLIHGEQPWSGGEPGPDRCIVHASNMENGTPFCQVVGYVTQRGGDGSWSLCKDLTRPSVRSVNY